MNRQLSALSASVLVTMLAMPAVLAQPGPMGPRGPMTQWGWQYGPPGYYYQDKQLDRATLEKTAKDILSGASKGQAWTMRSGMSRIPIVSGKDVVGNLWEDKDLKSLSVGAYWAGRFGTNAELIADGRVVGMLWVK